MGHVHFPEEQLMTYLRVFLPEGRLPAVLDDIAQTAIEDEVDDELALFAIAHHLMDSDDRRTRDLEAAVLVSEVGLAVEEVAGILDLEVPQVQAAVNLAWAESDGHVVDLVTPLQDGRPVDLATSGPAAEHDPGGAAAASPDPAPRWRVTRAWWLGSVAIAALIVLAVAIFSEAGTARLIAVGLDPVVAFLVVVGLIGGGAALLRAGNAPAVDKTPPPIGTPSPGRARSGEPTAPPDRRPATAADPSDGPEAPSAR